MSDSTDKPMVMVAVSDLYAECSYPMRPDAIAASDTCRRSATSAVIDPENGTAYYRCARHKGLLVRQCPGEVVTELPNRRN
jgi:hypothetical protein